MAVSFAAGFEDCYQWQQVAVVSTLQWACGYCGDAVASKDGYHALCSTKAVPVGYIRICPNCLGPTFFGPREQLQPRAAPGKSVSHLPQDLEALYDEARRSAAAGAPTAAVLVCRKILMHTGVKEKAEENKTFLHYVEYLSEHGFVPPNGKSWVDYIRRRGNEANHEIVIMKDADSMALITFVEMLLRFIYEFPNLVPPPGAPAAP